MESNLKKDIKIIDVIDETLKSLLLKVIIEDTEYCIKCYKNNKFYVTENNIYEILNQQNFFEEYKDIFVKLTFHKFNDFNIIDTNNLLTINCEFFLLMDLYDGDLFTLLNSYEGDINDIINDLIYKIKLLYNKKLYYVDVKLENVLYIVKDDKVYFVLCDLGSFSMNNLDFSFTIEYTNLQCIFENIYNKNLYNKKIVHTTLQCKKMILHNLAMSILRIYCYKNNLLLNEINKYDNEIINLYLTFSKIMKNIKYFSNEIVQNNYKIYCEYSMTIIDDFLLNLDKNVFLQEINDMITTSYDAVDENEIDNYINKININNKI